MLDRIKALLGLPAGPVLDGQAGSARAESPEAETRRLAAAVLLVEAARQDGDYDPSERGEITRLLESRFSLDPAAAQRLLARGEEAQAGATDLFRFTNMALAQMDEAERVALVEMLWSVILADGRVHEFEASLMRRVAGLLHVSDRDSALARQRALQNRAADA